MAEAKFVHGGGGNSGVLGMAQEPSLRTGGHLSFLPTNNSL